MSESTPLDLTTVANVKLYFQAGVTNPTNTDDASIQDQITAFSLAVHRMTSRANMDGSIPAASPFVKPQTYTENYDGTGNDRLFLRNWPINSVTSVTMDGYAVPQSTAFNVPGWLIDGAGKSLRIIGGYSPPGVVTFSTLDRLRGYSGTGRMPGFNMGIQNITVVYVAGFNGVPPDLELAVRKTVALYYIRKSRIGLKSQIMPQVGSTIYEDWEIEPDSRRTFLYYAATASGA